MTAYPLDSIVTASQGSSASLGGAWPFVITDLTNILGTTSHPLFVSSSQPFAVSGTVAVQGNVNVTQGTNPWIISGSVALSQPATVLQGTIPWQVSSSQTFTVQGAPGGQAVSVSGTVAATQGTTPWVISGSYLQNVSGSVALSQPATVLQGTTPWQVSSSQTFTVQGAVGGQAVSVSGTVNVGNFPATQSIQGVVGGQAVSVSGTVTALQGTSPWVVSSSQTFTVQGAPGGVILPVSMSQTIGVSGTNTLNIQGVVGGQAVNVSSSQTFTVQGAVGGQAVSVSGTITANQGAPNSAANAWLFSDVTNGVSASAAPLSASHVGGKSDSGLLIPFRVSDDGGLRMVADSYKKIIFNSGSISGSGSAVITNVGYSEPYLIVNLKSITGSNTPSITFTMEEVDPVDQSTVIPGQTDTTGPLTSSQLTTLQLKDLNGDCIKVLWTVSGTNPVAVANVTFAAHFAGNAIEGQAVDGNPVGDSAPVPVAGVDSSGNVQSFHVDSQGNMQVVFAAPASASISFGDITLASIITAAMYRTAYTEQTGSFSGSIVSSNAGDTSAGAGARTVTITWLDASGTQVSNEVITLNGTTPVNLTDTTKRYIEKIAVTTVGASGSNLGTITLRNNPGGAGSVVGTIAVGDNETFWAQHYVVSGKTCRITGTLLGSTSTTVGAGCTAAIKAKQLNNSVAVEAQVTDTLTLYGQSSMTPRVYTTSIPIAIGPARLLFYVTTTSSTSQTYRASFDFVDS